MVSKILTTILVHYYYVRLGLGRLIVSLTGAGLSYPRPRLIHTLIAVYSKVQRPIYTHIRDSYNNTENEDAIQGALVS